VESQRLRGQFEPQLNPRDHFKYRLSLLAFEWVAATVEVADDLNMNGPI
jgi:hypothetical protein